MDFQKFKKLPRALYFLFAGTMITRMGAFVFPYLTIYLSDGRGYGFEMVGLVLSIGSLGLLCGNFAGGMLTDKWSRKWTLILALVLNACGFAGLAFHYELVWWYAIFLFIGYVGSGMYTPAANTVVADLTGESIRPFAYTVNYVCINLGMGLGPLIGGFLAAVSYTWIFVGDVATSLVCAALIFVGVAETGKHILKQPDKDATKLGEEKSEAVVGPSVWRVYRFVLAFCLFYFFLIAPLMGMEYAVPLLIKKEFGASVVYVGVIYTINASCILLFSFLIEKLIRGRNEYLMMMLSGVIWTIGMCVALFGFSVVALMICIGIWTIGEIIASILVPSFVAKHVPAEYKGRFMAVNDLVRSFAGVICPVGLGLIWKYQSAHVVLATITALPIIGILCYAGLYFWVLSRQKSAGVSASLETQQ